MHLSEMTLYLAAAFTCSLLSTSQAYSRRIFQSMGAASTDDDFSFDPSFEWRTRRDQRNADLEAYLRQMMLGVPSGGLRRPSHLHHLAPVGQQGAAAAGGGGGSPWPPELQPLVLGLHQLAASSDFAVPPSDGRFFDPPPRLLPSHLYRDPVVGPQSEGKTAVESYPDLSAPRAAPASSSLLTEEETTSEEVIKTPLLDFATTEENILLVAIIAGSSTAAVVGVALLVYGFLRLQKKTKEAQEVEYPAYGVTGPNKESTPTGDRRLAHSAQMYHYQLTKQQIIAMESSGGGGGRGERRGSVSEADSEDDEENEEGDYTVYECPGLATTGEMEVKNPLFQDETTPATNTDQTKQ